MVTQWQFAHMWNGSMASVLNLRHTACLPAQLFSRPSMRRSMWPFRCNTDDAFAASPSAQMHRALQQSIALNEPESAVNEQPARVAEFGKVIYSV
jgi:hypothetical protein